MNMTDGDPDTSCIGVAVCCVYGVRKRWIYTFDKWIQTLEGKETESFYIFLVKCL